MHRGIEFAFVAATRDRSMRRRTENRILGFLVSATKAKFRGEPPSVGGASSADYSAGMLRSS
jgi:hypothetical protein